MEKTRRLAVLFSHLRQIDSGPSSLLEHPRSNGDFSLVSTSNCVSNADDQHLKVPVKQKNEENDCIFCKIIRGESHAFKLYEDDICLCILDSNPVIHGHSLIIPKSHFSSLEATPPSVVAAMCSKVPFISNAIIEATHCDSFNLLANSGTAAGQVIFHTHLHIIPRKANDQLWTSKSFKRKRLNVNQEVAELADRVREKLMLQTTHHEDAKDQGSTAVQSQRDR